MAERYMLQHNFWKGE